jgi:hypothetical protein
MADAIWNNRFILADPGKNEVVLWEDLDNDTQLYSGNTQLALSESFLNFERIKIYYKHSFSGNMMDVSEGIVIPNTQLVLGVSPASQGNNNNTMIDRAIFIFSAQSNTTCTVAATSRAMIVISGTSITASTANSGIIPIKIVGINRVSGSN